MSRSKLPLQQLEHWIKGLFKAFDRLDDDKCFLPHLDKDLYLSIHDQEYLGHDGFKQWMRENRVFFRGGSLLHHSHNFSFEEIKKGIIQVSFLLDFKAESKKGELCDHQVSETWIISNRQGRFRILSYLVVPIVN